MENKVVNGITHCANYMCNGCPYEIVRFSTESYVNSSAATYVRCMQALIDDIYRNIIKEVEES